MFTRSTWPISQMNLYTSGSLFRSASSFPQPIVPSSTAPSGSCAGIGMHYGIIVGGRRRRNRCNRPLLCKSYELVSREDVNNEGNAQWTDKLPFLLPPSIPYPSLQVPSPTSPCAWVKLMATLQQPQAQRSIHRPFGQYEQEKALEVLKPLLRVHTSTPTNTTCTRNFPIDNIVVSIDQHGDWSMWTSPKDHYRRDIRESVIFIGSPPVEIGSGLGTTYILTYNGHVGARIDIPHHTLRLVSAPLTPDSTSLTLKYIDGARILHLLRHSVVTGRRLHLRPVHFDGSFRSNNPILRVGDLILQVVYADTGASAGFLDDRIIPFP
ncbi:hypothetical protein NMY22_g16895 [Coprinellus aureogranulatus]|nr:hypothetical protein NMY22_g16895 [Coprinellus aureogranulatus]